MENWVIQLIEEWGYLIVFLGAMVEGESIILPAGGLAHEGFLYLPKVILVAFLGTLIADQSLYYLGRRYGKALLEKKPQWQTRAERGFRLLKQYDNIYILSFRFIYGIRIISPLIIGASGVSPKRFTVLNFIAAIIWSVLSCLAGYYLAFLILDNVHYLSKIILLIFVVGIAVIYGFYKYRKKAA